MRVHVEVSGGIAGLRLNGAVDTDTLPSGLRDRVVAALDTDRLARAADAARAGAPVPDERQWRVTLGGGTYELAESRLDGDQVEALDTLTTALVREARRQRGG